MTAEEYLTAFDNWQTQYIGAAISTGKDFAFRERRTNRGFELDADRSGWDHVFLDPGAPAPGPGWTVYRLHGVAAAPPPAAASGEPAVARHQRTGMTERLRTVFAGPKTSPLRLVG